MRFPRLCIALTVSMSFFVSACGDDLTQGTAPASFATPTSIRFELHTADGGAVPVAVNVWMGMTTNELIQVRVVNERSAPVAGMRVRFTTRRSVSSTATGSLKDAHPVVAESVSDGNGMAVLRDVTFPVRDTIADVFTVVATLIDDRAEIETSALQFSVRAWRDVSHFGGDVPMVLSTMPMARDELEAILPLGTFNRDDALPAADAMLMPRDGVRPNVRAMATGLVTDIDRTLGAITMRVRDSIRIRVSGLSLRSALWVGAVVREGEILGALDPALSGNSGVAVRGVAVRVFDTAIQRDNWVRPERYGARRSASFFVKYLADSLRSDAYALVRRAAPDLAGTIEYDRAGWLVGSWFDPAASMFSLAATFGTMTPSFLATAQGSEEFDPSLALGAVALTFAYDAQKPGEVRIAAGRALGGVIGLSGVRAVAWEDQDPALVAVGSGVVRYHLYDRDDSSRVGPSGQALLVQLVDDTHLRVELVNGDQNVRTFSNRAAILVR